MTLADLKNELKKLEIEYETIQENQEKLYIAKDKARQELQILLANETETLLDYFVTNNVQGRRDYHKKVQILQEDLEDFKSCIDILKHKIEPIRTRIDLMQNNIAEIENTWKLMKREYTSLWGKISLKKYREEILNFAQNWGLTDDCQLFFQSVEKRG